MDLWDRILSALLIILAFNLVLSVGLGFIGLMTGDSESSEIPHDITTLYYKHVPCVVEKVSTHRRGYYGRYSNAEVTVYNKQYNLRTTLNLQGQEAEYCERLHKGDFVYLYMYSLVNNQTKQVLNRRLGEIDIYY